MKQKGSGEGDVQEPGARAGVHPTEVDGWEVEGLQIGVGAELQRVQLKAPSQNSGCQRPIQEPGSERAQGRKLPVGGILWGPPALASGPAPPPSHGRMIP